MSVKTLFFKIELWPQPFPMQIIQNMHKNTLMETLWCLSSHWVTATKSLLELLREPKSSLQVNLSWFNPPSHRHILLVWSLTLHRSNNFPPNYLYWRQNSFITWLLIHLFSSFDPAQPEVRVSREQRTLVQQLHCVCLMCSYSTQKHCAVFPSPVWFWWQPRFSIELATL